MQGRVNADIIISGSSRATYHYDPRVIESTTGRTTFNIGKVGSQTDVQVAVLKAYLEHNRKPSLIVHNLDAFSFVTTQEIFEPAQYVPYLDDQTLYESLRPFDPNLAKSRYLPLYGYIVEDMNFAWFTGVRALLGRYPKEDYYRGFSPRDKEWTDEFERFKRGKPHGVSFAIEPAGVEALGQLIQLCKQNGIQLVLVYSPEYSEMQALTNNRIAIFETFRELANRNHVPLWDFSDWTHDGDRTYFYNSQHLNAKGAEAFSDDLALRLKDYLAEKSKIANGLFHFHFSAVIDCGTQLKCRAHWLKYADTCKGNRHVWCSKGPRQFSLDRPLISFTFDDFPRTALLNGGAILKRFGLTATYFTAMGLIGKDSPSGPIENEEDLIKALEDGHELGCHTYSHCHSWTTPTSTFEESVNLNGVALGELVPGHQFKSFSYPISEPRPLTKRAVSKYFQCCRAGGQTLNTAYS